VGGSPTLTTDAVRTGLWHPSPPAAKTRWARGENDEQAAPVAHRADSGPSLPQPFYAEESGSHRANPSADSAIAHTVLTTPPREGNGFTDSFDPAIRPRHYGQVCTGQGPSVAAVVRPPR
jgi:hypothetical protein